MEHTNTQNKLEIEKIKTDALNQFYAQYGVALDENGTLVSMENGAMIRQQEFNLMLDHTALNRAGFRVNSQNQQIEPIPSFFEMSMAISQMVNERTEKAAEREAKDWQANRRAKSKKRLVLAICIAVFIVAALFFLKELILKLNL